VRLDLDHEAIDRQALGRLLDAIRRKDDKAQDQWAAIVEVNLSNAGALNGHSRSDILLAAVDYLDASRAADIAAELLPATLSSRRGVLRAVDANDLMQLRVPPREAMLGAWLLQQALAMIHAKRGTGKTWFVLGVCIALAAAVPFLGWVVPKRRRVLLIDGEMPLRALQDRLRDLMRRMSANVEPGWLQIITPDLLGRSAPDLAVQADREQLDQLAREADVLILDNLSCLIRSGAAENDAESWVTVSDWALRHRAAGRSVIFVHHSGKSGAQRGTSRREDLLDVVIALRNPPEYDPKDGARFEVHFEKARHLHGPEAESFEATLDETAPGGWSVASIESNVDQQIVERLALGLSLTEIGRELGVHRSTVSRRVQDLKQQGVLPASGARPEARNNVRNTGQGRLDA
jgi:hypothetical protein